MTRATRCYLIVVAVAFVVYACGWAYLDQFRTKHAADWQGTRHVDPAGDMAALQGRWEIIQREGLPEIARSDIFLTIEDNKASYDYATLRERKSAMIGDNYTFVLNSRRDPKVIRYVSRDGPGEPQPGFQAPQSRYYSLEGDTLSIWDDWHQHGETAKWSYKRMKPRNPQE